MVTAKIIDLPHDIHGLTTIADDGSYVILLNARDSRERNRQSYLHELKHIDHGDLYCAEPADEVEYCRHKKGPQ
jgi:Zn-dependent peptidase ImmA (M78 family)